MSTFATFLASAGEFPAVPMPFFLERVSAGFPSPAQDYVDRALDLNELCIQRPLFLYALRVRA